MPETVEHRTSAWFAIAEQHRLPLDLHPDNYVALVQEQACSTSASDTALANLEQIKRREARRKKKERARTGAHNQ